MERLLDALEIICTCSPEKRLGYYQLTFEYDEGSVTLHIMFGDPDLGGIVINKVSSYPKHLRISGYGRNALRKFLKTAIQHEFDKFYARNIRPNDTFWSLNEFARQTRNGAVLKYDGELLDNKRLA